MIKLLIIADDYTGAADTGVQLAKVGIPTLVTTDLTFRVADGYPKVEVLVVDTESRHMCPEMAYRTVYNLAKYAREVGICRIYKKTDSTLRGNIGSELAAVMDATGLERLYFAPALPELNRTTVNGVQFVDGLPLSHTPFANDPFTPVVSSFVPKIIAQQTDIPVLLATPVNLKEHSEHIKGRTIVVIDSKDNMDFVHIAEQLKGEEQFLLAGNSGFSEILPDLIGLDGTHRNYRIYPKNALILCGSLNEISFVQTQRAEQLGIPSVALNAEQKQAGYSATEQGRKFLQNLLETVQQHSSLIIKTASEPSSQDKTLLREAADKKMHSTLHLDIARNVGQLVTELLRLGEIELLIVFGGDTFFGILENLPDSVVLPETEVLPGIVQSLIAWKGSPITVVSKAGGFGRPDTLVKLLQYYCLVP